MGTGPRGPVFAQYVAGPSFATKMWSAYQRLECSRQRTVAKQGRQKTNACEPTSNQRHSPNSASASINCSPITPNLTLSINKTTVTWIEATTVRISGTILLTACRPDSDLFWDYTLKIPIRYALCPRSTLKRSKPAEQGDMFRTRR